MRISVVLSFGVLGGGSRMTGTFMRSCASVFSLCRLNSSHQPSACEYLKHRH